MIASTTVYIPVISSSEPGAGNSTSFMISSDLNYACRTKIERPFWTSCQFNTLFFYVFHNDIWFSNYLFCDEKPILYINIDLYLCIIALSYCSSCTYSLLRTLPLMTLFLCSHALWSTTGDILRSAVDCLPTPIPI